MLMTVWSCLLVIPRSSVGSHSRRPGTSYSSQDYLGNYTWPMEAAEISQELELYHGDYGTDSGIDSPSARALQQAAPGTDPDAKIVGGRVARRGEFPWIVSLSWVGGSHFCGGSLLTLNHVLTACHCTCTYKDDTDEDITNVEDVTMSAGSLYTDGATQHTGESTIQRRSPLVFEIHPMCRSRRKGGYLYDYAIVHPNGPFIASPTLDIIKLISLKQGASWRYMTDLVKNRRWCKVVGWGTTGISGKGTYVNISEALRVVGVQLISFAKCHELLKNFSQAYSKVDVRSRYQVCAKNDKNSDACKGDSGGGFVCGSYVFGLLSWGPSCGEKNTPSMYASIDGGWDFIVKSIFSSSSRPVTSVTWLLAVESVVRLINCIRNI